MLVGVTVVVLVVVVVGAVNPRTLEQKGCRPLFTMTLLAAATRGLSQGGDGTCGPAWTTVSMAVSHAKWKYRIVKGFLLM
jgi:hypothetical protein